MVGTETLQNCLRFARPAEARPVARGLGQRSLGALGSSFDFPGLNFGGTGGFLGGPGLRLGGFGVSWAAFLFLLGVILGALGVAWASWGTLGPTKVSQRRPAANFGFILESFWHHFGG